MYIFNEKIEVKIRVKIIEELFAKNFELANQNILKIQKQLYVNIPDNKRISYGTYYTIKVLGEYLSEKCRDEEIDLFKTGLNLFDQTHHHINLGITLIILSFYGLDDYQNITPYFEKAAAFDHWEVREFAAGFFQKIIKKYPEEIKEYYSRLVHSKDLNVRRFVSESLRPVSGNRWIQKTPEYSLSILRFLFKESSPYPRTSVGNNLSDLARQNSELIYSLVEELVKSGNKNSYWIAYRACRNLVKKEPIRVMNLLKVNEYKYKKRIHQRSDYQGN
jgi:3-methyladenine DNA glycosylase AlkC